MSAVAAVSTIRGDTDVAPLTIRHLLSQGVQQVYVAAGDDSAWQELTGPGWQRHPLTVLDARDDEHHHQQSWMDALAKRAHDAGAEWIVPFDADEFWLAADGRLLADLFDAIPFQVDKLYAELFHHHSWNEKVMPPERLPKVAYRWVDSPAIMPGNHEVEFASPFHEERRGLLEVRHWQYRSFEHFCEKVRDRNATLAPYARERGDGAHHTQYEGANEIALLEGWRALEQRFRVYDPIPVIT